MRPARPLVAPARRGIAVPAALYLLVIIGLLVGAGVFATTRLRRGASLHLLDAALNAAADEALSNALHEWPSETRARLRAGETDSSSFRTPLPIATRAVVRVTRLSPTLFWLVADVRADRWPEARRRVNLLVRVRPPPYAGAVALASAGDVSLGAAAELLPDTATSCEGADGPPPTAASPSSIRGAVALAPSARVLPDADRAAADSVAIVVGADSQALLPFDDSTWSALAASADPRYAAGSSALAAAHLVAYAAGDLELRGGAGSGVLLVEGRLTIAGPVAFTGLIVARAGVVTIADGASLTGLVVSAAHNDAPPPPVVLAHAVALHASRCAAVHALVAAVHPVAVHGRAWAELF